MDGSKMSETELEALLAEALDLAECPGGEPPAVDTFEAAGVMSSNRGLVVRIGDAEFQVTIVRSR